MELSYEFVQDEREGGQTTEKNYSTTYAEELAIVTQGWVYHPALLSYDLDFSPRWEQIRRTSSSDVEKTNSYLSKYYAAMDFLKYKPYSLSLKARRNTSTIRNSFAEQTRGTSDSYAAVFSLKYPILTTSLDYEHTEGRRTGFFTSNDESDQVTLDITHDVYLGHTRLIGIYKDRSDTTNSNLIEINQQSVSFDNNLDLGNKITLTSDAYYEETDQTDTLLRQYSIFETLDITHSRRLSTNYNLYYDKNNRFSKTSNEPFRTEAKSAGFTLHHRLYDNLYTDFGWTSSANKSNAGRDSSHNTRINWNYSRVIPWGSLRTNIGYSYTIRDEKVLDSTNVTVLVQDEASVFSVLSNSVELINNDIVQRTITVTERMVAAGLGITYTEGIDYRRQLEGRKTKIIRLAGSSIPNDGITIFFVHYRYVPAPAFDYELLRQQYGVALNLWSALSLYYSQTRASQDLIDGIPSEELINDVVHSAGGSLEWKYSMTSFDWKDEYTTTSPTEDWIAREIITIRPGDVNYIQLTAEYGIINPKDSGDKQRTSNFRASFERQLTPRSNILLEGSIRDISGNRQDTTDSRISTEYTMYYRIWKLTLRYIFRNEEGNDLIFRNHNFLFELKRELF